MNMSEVIRWLEDIRLARLADESYYRKRSRSPRRIVQAEEQQRSAIHLLRAITELKQSNIGDYT